MGGAYCCMGGAYCCMGGAYCCMGGAYCCIGGADCCVGGTDCCMGEVCAVLYEVSVVVILQIQLGRLPCLLVLFYCCSFSDNCHLKLIHGMYLNAITKNWSWIANTDVSYAAVFNKNS